MSSRFDWIMERVFEAEGGFADDPNDAGGQTKYGISKRYHPEAFAQIRSREDAKQFYRTEYYDPSIYEAVALPAVIAKKMFLFSIHASQRRAVTELQEALIDCGLTYITVDGSFGPQTELAIAGVDTAQLLAAYRAEIAGYYEVRLAVREKNAPFRKGWMKRARA